MQLDQILKAAVAAVSEEDGDKIEIPNVDDLIEIANSGVNIPQKDPICYAGDETADTQLDNTILETLHHEMGKSNQEETVPNFEDALGLANVEFDFKMKSSENGTAELPQDNELSAAHVSADMPLLDIEDALIALPTQSQLDVFSNDNCENTPFESVSIPSAEINPQISIDDAINTFTQEDFPKLLSGVVNQESVITDPVDEMSFFALDEENLVITSQQALEMFENTSEEAMAMVHHQDQFEVGSKERILKAPVNYIENGYNDKLKYKNLNHIVNQKDNNNIDINALAHEVYQQHCNDMDKKQKMYLQNSKTYSKARNYISQDVFNAIEETKNNLTSSEVLTTLEPLQYTSLDPVSYDTSLQESVLPSLTPEIPDGSTLDATVDENGQFVVKVVAPGMNMSVNNQYVSQCVQKQKQNNTNMVIGSSRQQHMKKKNYKLNNGAKLYPEFVKINNKPQGVLEEMKIKNEGSKPSVNFNNQHSQVLMALRESIYKSKAKRKSDDPSIENVSKRSRILNPSISEQDIKQNYPSNPIIFNKERVNNPLDSKLFDYMDNYNNNEFGYQPLPNHKVQEAYRRNGESKVKPRRDMKVLDPNEISAALQGRSGGQNPLVFMKPQEIQTGEGEDPLQVQLVYLVYPLENNDNEAEPTNGHPYKIQESQRPQPANSYPSRKDFNSHIPQEDPYQSIPQEDPYQSSQQAPYEELKSSNTSDYLRIPIREWSFSEVVTFMSKNQENLNIKINFSPLSGITGRELITLHIEELERVAPGHGYQLFRILHEFMKTQDAQMQYARRTLPSMNSMRTTTPDELYQQYNPPGTYYENKTNSGNTYVINPTPDNIMDLNQQGNQHVVMPSQIPKDFYQEFQNPGITYNYGKPHIGSMDTMNVFSNQSNVFYQDGYEELSDPDQSDNDDETPAMLPMPTKRGPGRPRKPENELKKKKKKTGRLWEFIRNLLHDPETCPSLIKWECPEEGVFRFVQAEKVAKMWGMRKLNTDMNYEKLSRAMRYYYKGQIFEAVLGRRLVYKFGKHAKGWQPTDPNFPDFQR